MNKSLESLRLTFLYDLIFPIFQIIKTINWYLKSKKSNTPHLIKQRVIRAYQKKYNLQIFIETGTYLGITVDAMKKKIPKIYSIELDHKLYKRAKNKFKKNENIQIIKGDSSIILPRLLRKINSSCLFWLDAHYSKGVTAKGQKETPIWEELRTILNHKIKHHVILIDDADSFVGKNDYPTIAKIKKIISANNKEVEIKNNIIMILPKN